MDLYLHFGIYKTGSSFLQTLCGRNRDLLREHAYFFPPSDREEDLLAGRISPGNDNGLCRLLQRGALTEVTTLLQHLQQDARAAGCEKILISAEALIHALATASGLDTLMKAVKRLQFANVHAFGFFRDPVDHCLSTYKHRAKRGTIASFSDWVENTYETIDVMQRFMALHGQYPVVWSFRKYRKAPDFMMEAFFQDWLNVPLPPSPEKKMVNRSLNLSEILLIQQLATVNADWVPYIYDQLLAVPQKDKAVDRELESNYRQVIHEKLGKHRDVITAWNKLMPPAEELANFDPDTEPGAPRTEAVVLGKAQLQAVAIALEEARHPVEIGKARLKKIYRKLRKTVANSLKGPRPA